MYQGVGMLSFNSYSLINIRFLINKEGVIMSHQDKKSLIGQADDRLQKMTQAGVGRSKHQDKIDDVDYKYIYTWKTYQAYIKHCCYFLDWCKENHGCKTLKQCRQYVPEWIESRRSLSASTQKLDVAALSKLYRRRHGRGQKPFKNVETDTRRRADYATKVYQLYARPIESLAHDEIYYCRGDRKGTWLDKKAMLAASKALGHNRISIIASNYLRL